MQWGRDTIDHLVLCVELEDGRLVALGSGGEDGVARRRWTIPEVRRAIGAGERFFLIRSETGLEADIECDGERLRTTPDGLADEELYGLRSCRWR